MIYKGCMIIRVGRSTELTLALTLTPTLIPTLTLTLTLTLTPTPTLALALTLTPTLTLPPSVRLVLYKFLPFCYHKYNRNLNVIYSNNKLNKLFEPYPSCW